MYFPARNCFLWTQFENISLLLLSSEFPSITEELLDKAIKWAMNFIPITEQHISIIKHARSSLLFNDEKPWIKRNNQSMFDVTMGSFDGAEVCELVGLFILNELSITFGKDRVGLYRDDGLILLKGTRGRLADQTRKKLHHLFEQFDLKITAEVSHQTVNFLDITLNLADGSYKPYRKPNNQPLYINSHSNHPPPIIKQLPVSINKRISRLSSDKQAFDSSAPLYEQALHHSNYQSKLHYLNHNTRNTPKRNRKRNISWFNPPYSKNVRSNIGKDFLHLVDIHFPKSSALNKIFNRNTIKVSYSCMKNVKSVISSHNNKILSKAPSPPPPPPSPPPPSPTLTPTPPLKPTPAPPTNKTCNCRDKNTCPLNKKCLTKGIVYHAKITAEDNEETRHYIGITATTFKERFRNHQKSFNIATYANDTELSKYIWSLKKSNRPYKIKWTILKHSSAYRSGRNQCNLCSDKFKKNSLLNKRSEIFSNCVHKKQFLAGKYIRVQSNNVRHHTRRKNAQACTRKQTKPNGQI